MQRKLPRDRLHRGLSHEQELAKRPPHPRAEARLRPLRHDRRDLPREALVARVVPAGQRLGERLGRQVDAGQGLVEPHGRGEAAQVGRPVGRRAAGHVDFHGRGLSPGEERDHPHPDPDDDVRVGPPRPHLPRTDGAPERRHPVLGMKVDDGAAGIARLAGDEGPERSAQCRRRPHHLADGSVMLEPEPPPQEQAQLRTTRKPRRAVEDRGQIAEGNPRLRVERLGVHVRAREHLRRVDAQLGQERGQLGHRGRPLPHSVARSPSVHVLSPKPRPPRLRLDTPCHPQMGAFR
jgi:hypothetical protein